MGRAVQCYVYDMTGGMAKTLGRLAGLDMEGIWHSSLVFGGVEHFYGYGLQQATPGTTPFGKPVEVIELGQTEMPDDLVQEVLEDLRPRYAPEDYLFLWHNCNHFCNEMSLLLTGNPVPEYLTNQGQIVMENPLLNSMMPMFEQMELVTGSATAEGFVDAEGNLMEGASPGQAFMNAAMARLSTASNKQTQTATADTEATAAGTASTVTSGAGSSNTAGAALPVDGKPNARAAAGSGNPSARTAGSFASADAAPDGVMAGAPVPAPETAHGVWDGAASTVQQAASRAMHVHAAGGNQKAVKGGVPKLPERKGVGAVLG